MANKVHERLSTALVPEPAGEAARGEPAEEVESIEDFVLSTIRIASLLSEVSIFARHDITAGGWAVLKAVGRSAPVPLKDVAVHTGISRQRLRMLLKQLEAGGLITVSQPPEGDQRARLVTASPEAEPIMQAVSDDLRRIASAAGGEKWVKVMARSVRLSGRIARELRRQGRAAREPDAED